MPQSRHGQTAAETLPPACSSQNKGWTSLAL